ncbi:hypothetical protein D1007_18349 [Hordeum vulgare]|nr:hypothetical protein D1007_18349 [Hordeum vulgare]
MLHTNENETRTGRIPSRARLDPEDQRNLNPHELVGEGKACVTQKESLWPRGEAFRLSRKNGATATCATRAAPRVPPPPGATRARTRARLRPAGRRRPRWPRRRRARASSSWSRPVY